MHAACVLFALTTLGAPRPAEIPAEPGVFWEQTVEMKMGGYSMPPQTTRVCLPRKQDWKQPPQAEGAQEDCQLKDVKRAGQKMSWKMVCANGMTGEGEMTWTGDAYAGTTSMQSQMGAMQMNMKGRKVGGDCDANETKRAAAEMQKGAEELQARADEQMRAACDQAVRDMDVMTIASLPQCKEKTGALCARLETREGFTAVADGGEQARREAEQLCKKDLASVAAKLCPAAAKDHAKGGGRAGEALLFVASSCPAEARPIAQRECAGRSYTDMEGAMRDFCVTYARAQLEAGEPATPVTPAARPRGAPPEPEPAPSKVEEGKKILKGLFGR